MAVLRPRLCPHLLVRNRFPVPHYLTLKSQYMLLAKDKDPMNRKRLIEVSLPLAKISEQVVREKAIRRGHISSLHTWWARRPQTLMRALIFASLLPEPETKEERYELDTLLENLLEMESAADERNPALQTAIQLVQESFPNELPRLLDPFMGSGTTGVEALRLGCETHAVDLNPVAYLIQLGALVFPKQFAPNNGLTQSALLTYDKIAYPTLSEAIRRWGAWVGKEVEKELGHLYKNPIGDEPINAYLWARTVQCRNPTCGAVVPLVRQWWLAKTKGLVLKPLIDPQSHEITFTIVPYDEIKKSSFDPNTGSIFRGTATCLVCKQAFPTTYIIFEACIPNKTQNIVSGACRDTKKQRGHGEHRRRQGNLPHVNAPRLGDSSREGCSPRSHPDRGTWPSDRRASARRGHPR